MKGQGTMEYPMTYGWALLVITIVGTALFILFTVSQAPSESSCSDLALEKGAINHYVGGVSGDCYLEFCDNPETDIVNGSLWLKECETYEELWELVE